MKWTKKESRTIWLIPVMFILLYLIGFKGSKSIFSFYIISLVVFLVAGFFCSAVHLLLLPKHRKIHLSLMISCIFLCVCWIALKDTAYQYYSFALYSLLGVLVVSFLLLLIWNNYTKEDVHLMEKSITPGWLIKLTVKNVLKNEVRNRFKGNVSNPVASRIATGVLTETLSSGRTDLFSDNLIPSAMSIVDHHMTMFETGGGAVANSHTSAFNPATGLAMTSDYYDAGGDVYGSSLNYDSHFSSGHGVSGVDSHNTDSFNSFGSGFDNRDY